MTIGIACTLPDGALLIVDSRYTDPRNNSLITDNAIKLSRINETMYAVEFGVVHASQTALRRVILNLQGNSSPNDIKKIIDTSLEVGWKDFTNSVAAKGADLSLSGMRVGLILGGLAGHIPFIAGGLRWHDGNFPTTIETNPAGSFTLQSYTLSNNQELVEKLFSDKANRAVNNVAGPVADPINYLINMLLRCAAETINEAKTGDVTVGGPIRYITVRRGLISPITIYPA